MTDSAPFQSIGLSYSTTTWVCWLVLLFCAGFFRRWRGIVLGEMAVATSVFMLQLRWAFDAVSQFERHRHPVIDSHFLAGVALSAMVVVVILLPVGLVGLWLAVFASKRRTESAPPPLPRE